MIDCMYSKWNKPKHSEFVTQWHEMKLTLADQTCELLLTDCATRDSSTILLVEQFWQYSLLRQTKTLVKCWKLIKAAVLQCDGLFNQSTSFLLGTGNKYKFSLTMFWNSSENM